MPLLRAFFVFKTGSRRELHCYRLGQGAAGGRGAVIVQMLRIFFHKQAGGTYVVAFVFSISLLGLVRLRRDQGWAEGEGTRDGGWGRGRRSIVLFVWGPLFCLFPRAHRASPRVPFLFVGR